MIVAAHNPETTNLEKTYLSSFVAKGAVSLPVKNNDRFVSGRKILIGRMGDEHSEIRTAGAIDAGKLAIATDATLFDHNADDPVYLLDWDQVRFYRRVGAGGAPILQATVNIDVDNADKVTRYDDASALATHYYQNSFYNSITGEESDLSDPIPVDGPQMKSAGAIIDQVVRRVLDTSFTVLSMDEYLDIMNEVGNDLLTQAQRPYRFLRKTATLNTTADTPYIDLDEVAPDLWKFNHIRIGHISGGVTRFTQRTPISAESFHDRYDNTNLTPQDNIIDIALDEDDNRLLLYPTPKTSQTGIIKLSYFKTFTPITSAGDVIETPNNLLYRYKLMAEYYSAKSEVDNQWNRLAEKYESKYGNEVVKMQRANRLDIGTPRSMRPPRMYRRRRYVL